MSGNQRVDGGMWRVADGGAARWVFPERPDDTVNQFADFLHEFSCEGALPSAELVISADTDFVVWLNGRLVGQGQYSNYPDAKTYERFSLAEAIRVGRNRLAVTVFYNGRTSSVYRRGDPGLLFEVRGDGVLAGSGTETLCRANPCYHSGPIAIVSGQLAYTFGCDGRGDDGFQQDDYVVGDGWRRVCEAEAVLPAERAVLAARPVPPLTRGDCTPSGLVGAGTFRYDLSRVARECEATCLVQACAGLVVSGCAGGEGDQGTTGASPAESLCSGGAGASEAESLCSGGAGASAMESICSGGTGGSAAESIGSGGGGVNVVAAGGVRVVGDLGGAYAVSPGWLMQHAVMSAGAPDAIAGVPAGRVLSELDGGMRVAVEDLDGQDGVYLIFDLGREEVGSLELEIDAPAGTMVDMGYGEHLDDGRVRSFVGSRSFAGRYLCREGRQRFTHPFLRWAGRYLQICVHGSAFTLHQFSLRRCDYPVAVRGEVNTGSALLGRVHDVGCRTLHLCMHEHYEDTPWREQALYGNDARTQALCGYYAFGEHAMPAASFALLGESARLRDDGFLNLTAPAKSALTIPSFTLVWMLAVRDHYLYSGDDRLARAFLPQICSMLKAFLAERKGGLLPLRQVKGIWHFYDWSAGMSGYTEEDFARGVDADAPLNCYLILALEAAVQMLDWCGEPGGEELVTAAAELKGAVAERFWDAAEGVFRTHATAELFTELTQALAVLAGVGDDGMRDAVLERMARADSGLAAPGLSQSFYTFEALMTRKELYGAGVLAGIESVWGQMLDAGATTFWETIIGASDFSNAGSLCHGWSASPVYVLYHDVLGVRPLEPGFRTFAVDPMLKAAGICSGRVPVPGGEIAVSWGQSEGVDRPLSVTAPEGLKWVKQ